VAAGYDRRVTDDPGRTPLDELLDDIYVGQERLSRDEIHRRAVAADLPADLMLRVDALPEGEYALDEAAEALRADADV
jgi:hypothetical protein